MELKEADPIYFEVADMLKPHCEKVAIAGSVRRRCAVVNDIDIVAIPQMGTLRGVLPMLFEEVVLNGNKLARFHYKGVQIDLYYATPETWATLLLIRTGSKQSNISLCSTAQAKGWKLHANGAGLFNENGERVAGETEESIFRALGLRYREPWERN